jgi:uncharacterized protein YvpB
MRRSAFSFGTLIVGIILILAGCQSAASAAGRQAVPPPTTEEQGLKSVQSTVTTSPYMEETASTTRTPTPTLTPASPSATDTVATPTPTVCSAGGLIGLDGRAITTPTLPAKASIKNIYGQMQSLSLDCESRSAVDWAGFFGAKINELEFFRHLPVSDNPDKGFVGNVRGYWGGLPPGGYGVYAGPVALLLRDYDVAAYAYRGMTWDQLRAEVVAGRPVIVWVVGHVGRSTPVTMTVTGGAEILAARYEHTVILIGYDGKYAGVLDGSMKYSVTLSAFMESWNVLGDMAIVAQPLPSRPDCAGAAVELIP